MNGPVFSSAQRINASGARDALLLFGILMFSLPLKTPALQGVLEEALGVSFPLRLSTYTLLLPPWLGLIVWIHRKRIPEVWRRLKVPLLLLAALFLWMWLGAWFSEWRAHSLKHAGRYSIHLAVFLTLLLLLSPQNEKSALSAILLWFVLISGLTWWDSLRTGWRLQPWINSMGMQLEVYWPPERGRLSSLFENPNPYGVVSVAVFAIALHSVPRKIWVLGVLASIGSVWGIFQSGSRNALLVLLFLCGVFSILGTLKIFRTIGKKAIVLAVGFLLIGSLFLILRTPLAFQRLDHIQKAILSGQSWQQLEHQDPRFALYRLAVEFGFNHPSPLGSGVKTFGPVVSRNANGPIAGWFRAEQANWNAHNALLTIWVEMGWVGLLLALAFLAEWFRLNRKASLLVLGGGVVLCLGQVFDYFIWQITFMTVQSFAFALIAADASSHEDSRILATPEVQG